MDRSLRQIIKEISAGGAKADIARALSELLDRVEQIEERAERLDDDVYELKRGVARY